MRVLGVPVDFPSEEGTFTKALFGKSLCKLETMCSKLTRLPTAHVQYTLLRFCLDGCRLNFLTRCCNSVHTKSLVRRADAVLRQTLGDVLGKPLSDHQWAQARLPQRLGGLGIGSPVDMGPTGRVAASVDFMLRARQTLHLDEDLPLGPPDLPHILGILQATLGPEFEPLKGWL